MAGKKTFDPLALCSGQVLIVASFAMGGGGLFGDISAGTSKDATAIELGKGLFNVDGGTAGGVQACTVTLICFNELDSCSNRCNQEAR